MTSNWSQLVQGRGTKLITPYKKMRKEFSMEMNLIKSMSLI